MFTRNILHCSGYYLVLYKDPFKTKKGMKKSTGLDSLAYFCDWMKEPLTCENLRFSTYVERKHIFIPPRCYRLAGMVWLFEFVKSRCENCWKARKSVFWLEIEASLEVLRADGNQLRWIWHATFEIHGWINVVTDGRHRCCYSKILPGST